MAADTGPVAKAPRSMSVQPGPQGNAQSLIFIDLFDFADLIWMGGRLMKHSL